MVGDVFHAGGTYVKEKIMRAFGEVKSGSIIRCSGIVYVKTKRMRDSKGNITNAVNRWGSHVKFYNNEMVRLLGHIADYDEPEPSDTPETTMSL